MAKTLEELIILKRTTLRYLLARESRLLTLGKKPVNKKIANFVRSHQENNVWSNFCDSLNEDLTRNLNVFEWKFEEERKQNKIRRYRLFSESKEALASSKMFLCGGRMTETPVVKVEQGQLQGKAVASPAGRAYYSFQGIPYAKPPLGSLRFKAPQPHEPWEGIRDATSEGSVSAQMDIITKSFTGDENCLFLNVYTPTLDGAFLPVMVYIHGGALVFGSGNTDFYGPDYLVEKDVVVVTLNYRLGPLGFLCLNTPEVPGNAGIKDVVLALRWIKENIHNFGGNPGNLTIFGESAGGGIVSVLTASPLSKNLISRAIIQSGSALSSWFTQKNPVENARKLAKTLGCNAENVDEILEFLSATPAKDIVETLRPTPLFDKVLENDPNVFCMAVEKEFPEVEALVTEHFADLLKSGRVAQVPIMIGSTALEMAFKKTSDDLQNFIPVELNITKDSETSLAVAEELKKLYFKGTDEKLEYYQLVSDKFFNVDNHRYVQYLLQSTNIPVYIYKFDYVGELNLSKKLSNGLIQNQSMHMDELGYLFKNDLQKDVEPTPQDLKMRERIVRLWTNFAKTGNPTPDENHYITVTWLPAARDNEHYLHIAQELSLGSNYDKEKMEFWDSLYQKYYKIWDQPQPNAIEAPRNEPIIVETLTIVTSSSEGHTSETITTVSEVIVTSSEVVETLSDAIETSSEAVEMSSEVVETSSEAVETSSEVVEKPNEVEAVPEKVEIANDVVDTPKVIEEAPKVETNNVEKPQLNGNSYEKTVKRTSNEIKMVTNSNGVPKDVIRANDPPEDDLPKNIGVNKFVNFFESLGGKK